MHSLELLALVSSVALPLWNIPLLIRVVQRKSSSDMSLPWVWGVWGSIFLMLPWAAITTDIVFKVFSFVNFVLFSIVLVVILKYYKGEKDA